MKEQDRPSVLEPDGGRDHEQEGREEDDGQDRQAQVQDAFGAFIDHHLDEAVHPRKGLGFDGVNHAAPSYNTTRPPDYEQEPRCASD